MMNIHTTCISLNGRGILLMGAPGAGKSDLALRLIRHCGAVLVADDRTDIEFAEDGIWASCPKSISGKLEVRGVGICNFPFASKAKVALVVELAKAPSEVERLPEADFYDLGGHQLPLLKLYPFEASAIDKIVIKAESLLD